MLEKNREIGRCLTMAALSHCQLETFVNSGIAIQSEASRGPDHVTCTRNVSGAGKQFRLQQWQVARPSKAVTRQRRTTVVRNAAEQKTETKKDEEVVDGYMNQYCDIKKGKKKSIGEMEQDFLLALQSFYISEKPIMSNEEFDNLKEELLWEGSKVVVLSADEQKFMEASLAYQAGKPFLSDIEFDDLKVELKKQGSKVAVEGPRCSLRSKKVYSDTGVDYIRMTLLNLPAVLIALGVVFFLDDITGFEITFLLELPEPYSFIFTWFVVLPTTYLIAQAITNFVFRDFLILNGPCPNCGTNTVSFFGTILTVSNTARVNAVKCESCGSLLKVDLDKRMITLEEAAPAKA